MNSRFRKPVKKVRKYQDGGTVDPPEWKKMGYNSYESWARATKNGTDPKYIRNRDRYLSASPEGQRHLSELKKIRDTSEGFYTDADFDKDADFYVDTDRKLKEAYESNDRMGKLIEDIRKNDSTANAIAKQMLLKHEEALRKREEAARKKVKERKDRTNDYYRSVGKALATGSGAALGAGAGGFLGSAAGNALQNFTDDITSNADFTNKIAKEKKQYLKLYNEKPKDFLGERRRDYYADKIRELDRQKFNHEFAIKEGEKGLSGKASRSKALAETARKVSKMKYLPGALGAAGSIMGAIQTYNTISNIFKDNDKGKRKK